MKRWYDRFAALNSGRQHDMTADNYLDEIYAFFLNCYHLKDWLKNDSTISAAVQQSVEPHINANRSLRLCADLCNSQKHLVLRRRRRSGENPTFGGKQYGLTLGGSSPTIKLTCEIDATGGQIDAFQLATDCIAAWDAFLAANGLN
jgi:hypothetical protein